MPRLILPIVPNMHITHPRPFQESTLTCHPTSPAPLRTQPALAEGPRERPLELSRNGRPKATRRRLDQRRRVVCTTWLAILERPTRLQLQRITIPQDILMLQ